MKALLRVLFLVAIMMPLASCGGEEPDTADDASNAIEEVSDAANATATGAADAADAVLGKICCKGNCDAPAGTCCNDDGTCGGTHEKLPLMP